MSGFVEIGMGLVVVWFLSLVVAWGSVSCGCGYGVWLVFSRWFCGFCGWRWWWVSRGKCGGDGFFAVVVVGFLWQMW